MRVISGSAKGHKLVTPEGMDTRPTTDRIKETLFNMISPDIQGCRFLDIFSGSGSIGIEALSRGAEKTVFIDNSKEALEALKFNLNHTKLMDKAVILKSDAFTAIEELGKEKEIFDIIFIDPPYSANLYRPILKSIVAQKILNEDGFIITEHPREMEMFKIEGLKVFKTKDFKKTTIMSFWTLED